MAQVTLEFKTLGRLIDTVWSLEFPTYYDTVFGLGSAERTINAEATNTFLTSTYGEVVDEFDFGSAIFFPFSFNPHEYRVGTVSDDTGAKAITLAIDDAFVHAGAGNDQRDGDRRREKPGDEPGFPHFIDYHSALSETKPKPKTPT